MGWNALPQTSKPGEQSPQDLAIITWFEVCHDAGMKLEQYTPCFRAAQQRKIELAKQGQQPSIVTPYDLCAELQRVRDMHAEIDKSRLLPENAANGCLRCYGTGKEEALDGSIGGDCDHRPMGEREQEARRERHRMQAAELREKLARIPAVKAMPPEPIKEDAKGIRFTCTVCRRAGTSVQGWRYNDRCGARIPGPVRENERLGCKGVMQVF
jgi:hypothetical protein